MEQKVKGLLDQINKDHQLVEFSQQKPSEIKQRLLIGIFGTPGSGKTSVCQDMKKYLTEELKINCQVVPMDGFHYYRRELDMMEDPKHAHSRRGAPFTFNDLAFKNLLENIKHSPNQKVSAPSFDHGVGDPIEDDIHVEANQSIIIVEGNYLATWPNVTPLFDILIYIHTQTKEEKRLRINEFFIDFDKLRSGFVSIPQFRRCLSSFGMELKDADFDKLVSRFIDSSVNKVNYIQFATEIDKGMEKDPKLETLNSTELLKSQKPQLSATEELNILYEKLRWEAKTQGHIIKNYFKDFDPLNHGAVTRSQFLQCIPFRNLNAEELHLILDRYVDEKGDINYLRFHEEIENEIKIDDYPDYRFERATPSIEEQVDEIEKEIKKALIKYRIKLDESFRDFDRLRTGFITKAQFMSTLGAIKFHKMAFNQTQLDMLAEKYRTEDHHSESRVSYQEFLNNVYSVFNDKGLEKFPTKKFHQQNNIVKLNRKNLESEKEEKCNDVINKVSEIVSNRRVFMKPFFQDFDKTKKGTYSTDHVTRARFERALHMSGINLTQDEYTILEEKYDDLGKGDVNYKMFLEDVDEILQNSNFNTRDYDVKLIGNLPKKERGPKGEKELDELLEDISFKSLVNRIRLEEFMRDFDPLRSHEITEKQFRSALNMGGIDMTDKENEQLISEFKSPTKKGFVNYRKFCDTINSVITEKNLEKVPTKELVSPLDFTLNSMQKRGPQKAYTPMEDKLDELLGKLQYAVKTRGIAMKVNFEDFDKLRRGKISETQFIQCLDKLFNFLTQEDYRLLQNAYFEPTSGYVNYFKFIQDVDKNERVDRTHQSVYVKELELAVSQNFINPDVPKQIPTEISNVIYKATSDIVKSRTRLKEFFADFDKLRHNVVPKAKFRTALSMAKLNLSEQEIQLLEDYYKVDAHPDLISYTSLCEEVDRAFVENRLEKFPTKTAESFQARPSYPLKSHIPEISNEVDGNELNAILKKVATKAAVMQQILTAYFQDYDKLRKLRVTKTQFASILDFLKFHLNDKELRVLQKHYEDERGDIDYHTFCKEIDAVVLTL
ncbi:predicted protein [Naegleria gruberi]|uniref:Predicted protein n=1 Tax=Naegleria gruberi TaxID=5762 RepID=D2VWH8_NAEGR|nr:uncharacterized protein NAEGRDRAFT_59413 [Naegleria gruberi]EFC38896.1 predicted protein [Naegleria gruberi]|eukprot:XP_002671640.1 predicted protein [Naegleria gruberi strain NEG-M]